MSSDVPHNRSYEDIVLGVALAGFSAVVAPVLGTGKYGILGPVACIMGVVVWRAFKKRQTTPDDQKPILLNKVRERVQIDLNNAKDMIFGRRITVAAEQWAGQAALLKSPVDLDNGLITEFDASKSLLVLGNPGLGKTLLLLELGQTLVSRGIPHVKSPIVVVLSLSSWSSNFVNFREWLIRELGSEYQIPKKTADYWVTENHLILLLDGLDEVNQSDQSSCVQAINEHVRFNGVPGIAVCSRFAPYQEIDSKLQLNRTISLLQLTDEQILEYAGRWGAAGERIRKALDNPAVRDFASTPLMLNLLLTVIVENGDELEIEFDQSADPHSYLRKVFDLYIQHQLSNKAKARAFSPSKILKCLSWIALAKHQTNFMIEQLQPGWLGTVSGRRSPLLLLYTFFSRVAGTTAIMAVGIFMMYVCKAVAWVLSGGEARSYGLIDVEKDLVAWFLITAIVGGTTVAAIDGLRFWRRQNGPFVPKSGWKPQLVSLASNVAICVTVFALVSPFLNVSRAFYGSLMYGFALGVISWFRGQDLTLSNDIKIVQRLTWSWNGFWKGLAWGALGGLIVALLAGSVAWWLSGFDTSTNVAALAAIAATLAGGVMNGLKGSGELDRSSVPNSGIRASAKNAVRTSIYVALPFAVVFWIYGMFATGSLRATLESGLFFGVVVGIIAGFSYGGLDVVYHYVLRPFLWLDGFRVIQYKRFLEYATTLNFLQRSGAGYKFFHDLIAVHFKELTFRDSPRVDSNRGGGTFRTVSRQTSTATFV